MGSEMCIRDSQNGNRVAKVLLDHDIPQFAEVDGCNCRIWYPRQPSQCSLCKEFGHRAPACPLSGLCRRCHQPGHMARECTQAWGPSFSALCATISHDHVMETEDTPVPDIDDSDAVSSKSEDEVPVSTAATTSVGANFFPFVFRFLTYSFRCILFLLAPVFR